MRGFEWTKKHTTILIYTCCTILISVALALVLLFPSAVMGFLGDLFSVVSPVFFGFIIAYLLHPLCDFYNDKVFGFLSKKVKGRFVRFISVICTFITAALVVTLFVNMVVPQLKASYLDLESRFNVYLKETTEWVNKLLADEKFSFLSSLVSVDTLSDSLGGILSSAFGIVSNIANTLFTFSSTIILIVAQTIVSFIFAGYFLLEKDIIISWFSRLSSIILPEKVNKGCRKWINCTDEVFGSFISGKVLNALIITAVNFIVFGLFDIPYYPLIAVITGVTDMIPYFGPFIGAIPSAFIILIADPFKAVLFGILVLVIQQIDGNFVGPKILGEKVGVDSLLVIVAITVSGGLFGIIGMFIGVPVFTIAYRAFNAFMEARLEKKKLPTALSEYMEKKKEAAK